MDTARAHILRTLLFTNIPLNIDQAIGTFPSPKESVGTRQVLLSVDLGLRTGISLVDGCDALMHKLEMILEAGCRQIVSSKGWLRGLSSLSPHT